MRLPRRLLVLIPVITLVLAGCAVPEESLGRDPDRIHGEAVQEEVTVDEEATPEAPARAGVSVDRDTRAVEVVITLTDVREPGDLTPMDPALPEDEDPRDPARPMGDQPVDATVRLEGPDGGVLGERVVTVPVEPGPGEEQEVRMGQSLDHLDDFWAEAPEGVVFGATLIVEVTDGPVLVTGHLRALE